MNWCLTWLFFSLSTQTLLSQTREKQASTLSEVTWQGRTVPVKNEPVRLFLLNLQESSQEVEKTEGEENKISIYESILKQCIDAQQVLRDSLQDDQVRYTHQRWQNTLNFYWSENIFCSPPIVLFLIYWLDRLTFTDRGPPPIVLFLIYWLDRLTFADHVLRNVIFCVDCTFVFPSVMFNL